MSPREGSEKRGVNMSAGRGTRYGSFSSCPTRKRVDDSPLSSLIAFEVVLFRLAIDQRVSPARTRYVWDPVVLDAGVGVVVGGGAGFAADGGVVVVCGSFGISATSPAAALVFTPGFGESTELVDASAPYIAFGCVSTAT